MCLCMCSYVCVDKCCSFSMYYQQRALTLHVLGDFGLLGESIDRKLLFNWKTTLLGASHTKLAQSSFGPFF